MVVVVAMLCGGGDVVWWCCNDIQTRFVDDATLVIDETEPGLDFVNEKLAMVD